MRIRSMLCVICVALLLCSCAKEREQPPAPVTAFTPTPVKLEKELKLGSVRILDRYGYRQDMRPETSEREKEILQLIAGKIRKERNVSMDLTILYPKSEDCTDFDTLCAAGDPPEIFIDWPDESVNDTDLMPCDLTPAIGKYGPNLVRIPANCWEASRIGTYTYYIPMVVRANYGLMANIATLKALDAKLPATMEELESLLGKAYAAKYNPIVASIQGFQNWFGLNGGFGSLYRDDKEGLRCFFDSPAFLSFISTERKWKENGWCYQERAQQESFDQDKWLFAPANQYFQGDADVVAVPPLQAAPGGPGFSGTISSGGFLLSYQKPEALVTLADWLLESEGNYNLLYLGQEGVDYEWVDSTVYRSLSSSAYTHENFYNLSLLFDFSGIYPRHREQKESESFFKAQNDLEEYIRENTKPSRYEGLPGIAGLYARGDSRLKKACTGMDAYVKAMSSARWQYVAGEITLDEFIAVEQENEKLAQDYIKLTQEYLAGTYDPVVDMNQPRVLGGN